MSREIINIVHGHDVWKFDAYFEILDANRFLEKKKRIKKWWRNTTYTRIHKYTNTTAQCIPPSRSCWEIARWVTSALISIIIHVYIFVCYKLSASRIHNVTLKFNCSSSYTWNITNALYTTVLTHGRGAAATTII